MDIPNYEIKELDMLMASMMNGVLGEVAVDNFGGQKKLDMYLKVPDWADLKEDEDTYKALYNIAILTANLYGVEVHAIGNWFKEWRIRRWVKKNNLMTPAIWGKRVKEHKCCINLKKLSFHVYMETVENYTITPLKNGAMNAFSYLYKVYYAQ